MTPNVYKSKNKDYMNKLKNNIYRLEKKEDTDYSMSWLHIRNFTILNDLIEFIKSDPNNTNQIDYYYNAHLTDIDYMIITTTQHPKEEEIANAFIKAMNVDRVYKTSYTKSKSGKVLLLDSLTSSLKSEIKMIQPKKIILFSPAIGKALFEDNCILHEILNGNTIITYSIISVIQYMEKDIEKAKYIKRLMWQDFKKLDNI